MSPALTPLVSCLERAASLMDRGVKPSAALRQVVRELADYERTHTGPIPAAPFDIGTDQPVRERVI